MVLFQKTMPPRFAGENFSAGAIAIPALRSQSDGVAPKSIKVLITGKLNDIALKILQTPPPELSLSLPIEIRYLPDCDRETLLREMADVHVLVSRSETDVDAEILRAGKVLSVVARAAVGYGNIDVDLATELGVLVVNTPGKNTNSAAELSVGLMLSLVRHITTAHASTSQGGWNRHAFTGSELGGKTLGIVGLGNVGHRVAKFARGFDMRVIGYDPYIADEVFRKNQCERKMTLEELLVECDVLSVHVPLNRETKGMVGEIELRKMKRGSIVINAARGGIISEKGLLRLLDEGYISGAGIDTWETEPHPLKELVSHSRVVSTPHIGASTGEAQFRIGETIAVQVLKALRGEIVDYPVNLPHVSVLGTGLVRHYSVLAEKVARIAAQVLDFPPVRLSLLVQGDIDEKELALLRLSTIKGFVANSSDEFVSYVNAERLFQRRGLSIEIGMTQGLQGSSRHAILLEISGSQVKEKATIGAVLYDGQTARLNQLNEFLFEIEPEGEILILQNHDRPGVIGDVGSYLAKQSINIAQFELSRNRSGGMAMSLIRVDGPLDADVVTGLRKLPNVISAKWLSGL